MKEQGSEMQAVTGEECQRSVMCSWDSSSGYDEVRLREAMEVYGSIEKVCVSMSSSAKVTGVVVFKVSGSASGAVAGWSNESELKLFLMRDRKKQDGLVEEDGSVETAGSGEAGLTSEEDLQTAKKDAGGDKVAGRKDGDSDGETSRGLEDRAEDVVEVKADKRSKKEAREKKKEKRKRKKEKPEKESKSKERKTRKEEHGTSVCLLSSCVELQIPKSPETRKRHRKDDRDRRRDDEKQKKKERHKDVKQREDSSERRHRHRSETHHRDGDDEQLYYREDDDYLYRHRNHKDEGSRDRYRDSSAGRRKEEKDSQRTRDDKERRDQDRDERKKRHRSKHDAELKETSPDGHRDRERTYKDDSRFCREQDHSTRRRTSRDGREEDYKHQERGSEEKRRCSSSTRSTRLDSRGRNDRRPEAGTGNPWNWNTTGMPPFGYHYGAGGFPGFPTYGYSLGPDGYPHFSTWYKYMNDPRRRGAHWDVSAQIPEKSPEEAEPKAKEAEPEVKNEEVQFAWNLSEEAARCSRRKRELLSRLSVSEELAGAEVYKQYLEFMAEEDIEIPNAETSAPAIAASGSDDDFTLEADPEALELLQQRKVSKMVRSSSEPADWAVVEEKMRKFNARMREATNDASNPDSAWDIFQISHQRTRYIHNLYENQDVSRELLEYCIENRMVDKSLINMWKKQGFEQLCCLSCMKEDHSHGTGCICRVPQEDRKAKAFEIECDTCGCTGCASKDYK